MLLGTDDDRENIGFVPLLALAAPLAKDIAMKAGGQILGKVLGGGNKPPPPPCTFGQKIGRIFGSKPNCR
jgi:hypothetical protein